MSEEERNPQIKTIKAGETMYFHYKGSIHTFTPKIDLDMRMHPHDFACWVDSDYYIKHSMRILGGVQPKAFLDSEYGKDPKYLPVLFSKKSAERVIAGVSLTEFRAILKNELDEYEEQWGKYFDSSAQTITPEES